MLAAIVGSVAFYSARALDNVLTVTGSAKVAVTSDSVKWTMSVTRKVGESGITAGYAQVARDVEKVETFLKGRGISENDITTSTSYLEEVYRYDNSYGPREFNIRQNVVVSSSDVGLVDALSKSISELSAEGVFVSNNWIEFYVSSLPELRVSLLGEAITDARARAEEIAKAGDRRVGALKSASSGVVQVLAKNSVEISDYGSYDTQSLEKEVMVTVRAVFFTR